MSPNTYASHAPQASTPTASGHKERKSVGKRLPPPNLDAPSLPPHHPSHGSVSSPSPISGDLASPVVPLSHDKLIGHTFSEILLEVVFEAVTEFERSEKKRRANCEACGQRCRAFVTDTRKDIYGKELHTTIVEKCDCLICGNPFPAARYAPHLDKCIGNGRNARLSQKKM